MSHIHDTGLTLRTTSYRAREARNFAWGLFDQSLSSATNFGGSVLAARALPADDFGAFAIGFAAYLIALGVSRAWSSEPLHIRFSAASVSRQQSAIRSAAASGLAIGAITGLATAAAGMIIGGRVGNVLVVLAIFLPGLMLQDLWRFALVMMGRSRSAAANDGIWLISMLALFLALPNTSLSANTAIGCWAGGATLAAIYGLHQLHSAPSLSPLRWWTTHADLSWPYSGEFILLIGLGYALTFGIAARNGLADAGGFRGAQVLMGPLNILFFGAGMQVVPIMVRRATRSLNAVTHLALVSSTALTVISTAWGLAVVMMPQGIGMRLMGDSWAGTSHLLAIFAVGAVSRSVYAGPRLGIKSLGAASQILRTRLIIAPIVVVLGVGGAATNGAVGAAAGLTTASTLSIPIWWLSYRYTLRQQSAQRSAS